MDHNLLVAITSMALALAGFTGIILMGMARTTWSLRRALHYEERNRHQIIENIKQALRITFAYDAAAIVRKFIEEEQQKLPKLYVKTNDPNEPYVYYDLNLAKRWMKPIRLRLERELTGEERPIDPDLIGEAFPEAANSVHNNNGISKQNGVPKQNGVLRQNGVSKQTL